MYKKDAYKNHPRKIKYIPNNSTQCVEKKEIDIRY